MVDELSVISRFQEVNCLGDGLSNEFPLLVLSSTSYRHAKIAIERFLHECDVNKMVAFDGCSFTIKGCRIIPFSDYRKLAGYDSRCKLLRVY